MDFSMNGNAGVYIGFQSDSGKFILQNFDNREICRIPEDKCENKTYYHKNGKGHRTGLYENQYQFKEEKYNATERCVRAADSFSIAK